MLACLALPLCFGVSAYDVVSIACVRSRYVLYALVKMFVTVRPSDPFGVFVPLLWVVFLAQFNAAIPDYFTDFPMVMFMISGVLLSEAGHAVSLDDRARVAETRYSTTSNRVQYYINRVTAGTLLYQEATALHGKDTVVHQQGTRVHRQGTFKYVDELSFFAACWG